jgi:hypothetical protein
MFDLDAHGDPRYANAQPVDFEAAAAAAAAAAEGAGNRPATAAVAPAAAAAPQFPLRPRQGKMEKSFLSFSMHNPHWRADNEGLVLPAVGAAAGSAHSGGGAAAGASSGSAAGGASAAAGAVPAAQGGQRFLQGIAESIVTGLPRITPADRTPPMLSRESSEQNNNTEQLHLPLSATSSAANTPRKFRPAGTFASRMMLPSVQAQPRLSQQQLQQQQQQPASHVLPNQSTGFARQDSLDSNTTDESGDGGGGAGGGDANAHEDAAGGGGRPHAGGMRGSVAASHVSSASYMLSQSDRHLIQSFADIMGMDGAGSVGGFGSVAASALHPSVLMRQSSWGQPSSAGGAGGASTLGMSTYGSPQRPGTGLRSRAGNNNNNVLQSNLLRSQFVHNGSNSVLLGSTLLPRQTGTGGLQGGLTSSALLHMDPQRMREQLMLAQADQQADLFALLQARADEAQDDERERKMRMGATVPEEEEEDINEDEQEEEEEERDATAAAAAAAAAGQLPSPNFALEMQQSHGHAAPPLPSPNAQQLQQQLYASSSSPPQSAASLQTHLLPSSTDSARSNLSPGQLMLHRQGSGDDDNEPPPMSFFEPDAR